MSKVRLFADPIYGVYVDVDEERGEVVLDVAIPFGKHTVVLDFDEVEEDIRVGWAWEDQDYETMRPYVKTGYERTIKR